MSATQIQSAATSVELTVPPNTTDPGWQYGYKKPPNKIICRLCGKVTSGGINRFKKHIAHIKGDIISCPNSTEEMQRLMREHLEAIDKAKPEKAAGHVSAKIRKKKSSDDAEDPSSPYGIDGSKFDSIPTNKCTRQLRNIRSKDDKKPDTDFLEKAVRHVVVSTKRRKKKSSEDADDPSSASETDSTEFDSLPSNKRTRQLRNTRRSKDDKKLDTDIFESFLEDLWRKISDEKRKSFAYFDSLWFSLYKEEDRKAKVLQWIKNKEIFSRNYIFVPIVCWSHWSLLILCHFGEMNQLRTKGPCMLLLDSLLDAEPKRLEPDIRRFIFDIFESEGRTESRKCISNIPLLIPKVPQQRNGDECGAYVLYFIHLFLENAPDDFSQQGFPHFLTEEWFTQDDFDNFSLEIESFSMSKKKSEAELQEPYMAENSSPGPVECRIHTGSNIIEID